jgi:hypothetical protein
MPAQSTYTPIATFTLSSNGQIIFTSIPQIYTDLRLVMHCRSTVSATNDQIAGSFNGDGSALYSRTSFTGDGSSATSFRQTGQSFWTAGYTAGNTATANIFSTVTFDIQNYSNTTAFKVMIVRAAGDLNGSGVAREDVNLYRSTNAITQITMNPLSASGFLAGSMGTLYGIVAA